MELYLPHCIYLINPREIRSVKYYQTYGRRSYSPMKDFDELSDEDKEHVQKFIEIEMYGRDNYIEINVSNDNENELYKEIRQKLARKFGMNLRNNKTNEYIITLFEKGIEIEKIAEILKIRKNNVNKIIEEYRNKKN
jgi:formylmethanofuran dehydrogenase subunit A